MNAESSANELIQDLLFKRAKGEGSYADKIRKSYVPIEDSFRNDVCSVIANGCISDPHSPFDTCRPVRSTLLSGDCFTA